MHGLCIAKPAGHLSVNVKSRTQLLHALLQEAMKVVPECVLDAPPPQLEALPDFTLPEALPAAAWRLSKLWPSVGGRSRCADLCQARAWSGQLRGRSDRAARAFNSSASSGRHHGNWEAVAHDAARSRDLQQLLMAQ